MGKRGNNEGMIRKRADERWEARISLPDGTRKSFYGKTRQEAAQQLIQAQHDLAKGLPIVAERQTVEQYLTSWLEVVKTQVRASTYRRCGDYVRLHLVPKIGKVILSKLTAQQVQLLYSQKLKEGLYSNNSHADCQHSGDAHTHAHAYAHTHPVARPVAYAAYERAVWGAICWRAGQRAWRWKCGERAELAGDDGDVVPLSWHRRIFGTRGSGSLARRGRLWL